MIVFRNASSETLNSQLNRKILDLESASSQINNLYLILFKCCVQISRNVHLQCSLKRLEVTNDCKVLSQTCELAQSLAR
jgi:hypothetical protein